MDTFLPGHNSYWNQATELTELQKQPFVSIPPLPQPPPPIPFQSAFTVHVPCARNIMSCHITTSPWMFLEHPRSVRPCAMLVSGGCKEKWLRKWRVPKKWYPNKKYAHRKVWHWTIAVPERPREAKDQEKYWNPTLHPCVKNLNRNAPILF